MVSRYGKTSCEISPSCSFRMNSANSPKKVARRANDSFLNAHLSICGPVRDPVFASSTFVLHRPRAEQPLFRRLLMRTSTCSKLGQEHSHSSAKVVAIEGFRGTVYSCSSLVLEQNTSDIVGRCFMHQDPTNMPSNVN